MVKSGKFGILEIIDNVKFQGIIMEDIGVTKERDFRIEEVKEL